MPHQQTIYLARHGSRVDWVDPQWRVTAPRPFDPPLSPQGHIEAERLARRLAAVPIECIYCSPLLRALQTATPVARATAAPLRIEPGACEWLHADWFTCVPEFAPASPSAPAPAEWTCEQLDAAYASPVVLRHPERWDDVAARAHEMIHRLVATGADFLLVGHGATVIGSVAALLRRPAIDTTPPPTASLFKLTRASSDAPWQLELDADTTHLADARSADPADH